ncbi:MAG: glycine cleavage system protein GcvH [candidate division Zixibacteria bacterium]|nr:glycine cleavage system protein GcvH [Candidatus Tariuqbacter arcticus]
MEIPKDLYYTEEHEWIRVEGDVAIIGITDYAQDALSDIIYVEINYEVGAIIEAFEAFGSVEASKQAADLYAPVSGEIIGINTDVVGDEGQPELVNQSPYEDGWMIKIRMSDKSELDKLMPADAYRKMIEG